MKSIVSIKTIKKFLILSAIFVLGGVGGYFVKDYSEMKDQLKKISEAKENKFKSDLSDLSDIKKHSRNIKKRIRDIKSQQDQFDVFNSFDSFDSDVAKIHKTMQERINSLFDNSFFGSSSIADSFFDDRVGGMNRFGGFRQLKIQRGEDQDYKYVRINAPNLDQDSFDIKITNGMIIIKSKTAASSEDDLDNSQFRSQSYSEFTQSINVPHGVDENNASINTEDGSVVIKFPKVAV